MTYNTVTRRGVVISLLVLAACQTTGTRVITDRPLADKYDGTYEIYIGRFGRDTALQRTNNEVGTESELARLTVQSSAGQLQLVSLQDRTRTGPNYQDLKASFAEDGTLSFNTLGNILFDIRDTRRLRFEVNAGESLLAGETVSFLVNDWDANWAASVRIRKL